MTVSTSYSFNPSCDQILRMALQLAGLVPLGRQASAAELQHGRFFMDAFFKSAQGAKLMQMERTSLPVVAGTSTYALDADTIEVEFPMMFAVTGQSTQTPVSQLSWHEYQAISNKDTQGTPVQCYVEKASTVTLVLWNVPSQAGTLSYRRQRLIRDAGAGNTMDLTQRWIRGVAFHMAADMALAASLKLDRVKYLRDEATALLADSQRMENDRNDLQFCLPPL